MTDGIDRLELIFIVTLLFLAGTIVLLTGFTVALLRLSWAVTQYRVHAIERGCDVETDLEIVYLPPKPIAETWRVLTPLELPEQHHIPLYISNSDDHPAIRTMVQELSLDDLRRHCADVEPDPVYFTREGEFHGFSAVEQRRTHPANPLSAR